MISIYLFLLLLLCVAYLIVLKKDRKEKYEKYIYAILMIVLWAVLCLRYGQGSDYFSYEYLFKRYSDLQMAIYNPFNEHGEIGFRILCAIFPWSYKWFIAVVSTFEMLMLHRFIKKYSSNTILTLLLFYPTYYLTYYFSIIRQGIVIAFFIGLLLPWLENKKWVRYYLFSALLVTIHSSAIILLLIPLVKKIKMEEILTLDCICAAVGILMSTSLGMKILNRIPRIASYVEADLSIMALVERVTLFAIMLLLFFYRKKYMENEKTVWLLKIYSFGIAIYMIFLAFPLISSRFMAIFKVLEVVILTKLLEERSKYRQLIILFLTMFTVLMTCKNLDSYLDQGSYKVDVTFYTYPYITIFNEDDIWDYREPSIYQKYINSN